MNKERINQISLMLTEREKELTTCSDAVRIEAITAEVRSLTNERATLIVEMKNEARNAFATGSPIATVQTQETQEQLEQRARDLKQGRAISIAALDILHVDKQSGVLSPAFNQVSNLVDLVRIVSMIGAESYTKGYMKSNGMAGYTAEGGDYNAVEPAWGYIQIGKAKLTAYTEVPEEFEKLAPEMYLPEIKRNLEISLKRKLALEILKGAGTTNTITGILTAAYATAIETSKDLELSTIDDTTLDKIIFAYGGSEDIADGVLILSKTDLLAFANVKGTNEKKKCYDIDYKAKTINGIPYVINSNITALSAAAASAYSMVYGSLANYELTVFSALDVQKSTDYKFKQGQIAYKVSGFFGGNVVTWNGFVRIKKPAA
ncbi:MAG: hypothetical protein A2Y16_05410 [Tenericutes bacterium GWF2_57_13]|nr:MAG: hypothetical protein A2Y16_05410 [Tenericutes bacterium GWF2_57_13]